MPEDTRLEGTSVFRGVEYVVAMQVKDATLLTVTVEDRLTANQWKGSFDTAYIEDMTHKTGNYKQFNVFVNMLESAIAKLSDSVTMDLLTFSDLELLRKRKAGVGTQNIPGANNPTLTQKRYLILTYTVEFDKIHYPLPLPYAGKPDPEVLQETIRKLQSEIKSLKSQESKDYRVRELEKLKNDYDSLLSEKKAIEEEFILYRKEIKHTSVGSSAKEIRILKGVVKNLEEELTKEKAKHQRMTSKRRKEYEDLLEEVEELRTSERALKVRLKSITNELAVYKRKAIAAENGSSSRKNFSNGDYTSSQQNSFYHRERSTSRGRIRSLSQERRGSKYNPNTRISSPLNQRPMSAYEYRSSSRERTTPQAFRPSPSGTRKPRFDPTAYIEERKRLQSSKTRSSPQTYRENGSQGGSLKKTRFIRSSPNLSTNGSQNRPSRRRPSSQRHRTSSVESLGSVQSERLSRNNSFSDIEAGNISDGSRRIAINRSGGSGHRDRYKNKGYAKENVADKKLSSKGTPNTSTPHLRHLRSKENLPTKEADYINRSADIDDIDARLKRIQEMMKAAV